MDIFRGGRCPWERLQERYRAIDYSLSSGISSAAHDDSASQACALHDSRASAAEDVHRQARPAQSSDLAQLAEPNPWQDVVASGRPGPSGHTLVAVDSDSFVFELKEVDLVEAEASSMDLVDAKAASPESNG